MPKPTKAKSVALEVVGTSAIAPFNEKEVAGHLIEAIHQANTAFGNALRKVVVCGLLLIDASEKCPKGEFGPWLRKYCFGDLDDTQFESQWRNARRWMETARGLCESLQLGGQNVRYDGQPLHIILQLESCDLTKEQRSLQSKVFDFLEGKTQRQLQLEWRNADPTPTGGFRPNRDELNDWLAKHGHEGLVGKPFTKLPAKVQEAFHKSRAGKPKPVDPKKELRQRYALVIEQAHETIAKLELFTDEALTELGEAGAELGKEIPEFKTIVSDLLAASTRMNVRIRDLTKGKSK
jgi:hypothetical protein